MTLLGTLGAYYIYEWTHYSLHARVFAGGPLAALQRWHLYHHHRDWKANFGVTNPLWDMVFGTFTRTPGKK